MLKDYESPGAEPVPPECRATVELLQRALDGDATAESLDADTHAVACATCRERVRAARVLLSVLAMPSEPVAVPAGFADRVVTAMWAERHERTWNRSFVAAFAALAASVLVVVGLNEFFRTPHPVHRPDAKLLATKPEPAPEPRPNPPALEPRPIRVGDALANTGQAILDAPKPFAESVAVAPKLLDMLSGPFKMPAAADPMTTSLEPARKSLADLPDAARTGLEPVTGTAEKAFNRFLRDVGSVKPHS